MIIISEIPNDKFLIRVNADEIANILGEYSLRTGDLRALITKHIMEGNHIPISDIYTNHRDILNLQNEYTDLIRKLNKVINTIKPVEKFSQEAIKIIKKE